MQHNAVAKKIIKTKESNRYAAFIVAAWLTSEIVYWCISKLHDMSVCYLIATIVIQCSAIGATCCYGVTSLVGRRIVVKYFPEKVKSWSEQVSALVLPVHDWGL